MESIWDLLEANKLERANRVLKQLFKNKSLNLYVDGYVLIQEKTTNAKIQTFCTIHSKTKRNLKVYFIDKFWKNWILILV